MLDFYFLKRKRLICEPFTQYEQGEHSEILLRVVVEEEIACNCILIKVFLYFNRDTFMVGIIQS